jgi:hypothetical protein
MDNSVQLAVAPHQSAFGVQWWRWSGGNKLSDSHASLRVSAVCDGKGVLIRSAKPGLRFRTPQWNATMNMLNSKTNREHGRAAALLGANFAFPLT